VKLFQKIELELIKEGYQNIIGIDEVGRGPAAGPMVFAGFLYNRALYEIADLNDSKKLSETKRNRIYSELMNGDFKYGIGIVWPKEIDEIGLSKASKLAICRVIQAVGSKVDYFLMDGNLKVPDEFVFKGSQSLIKGDSKSVSIAAASVVAKVFRDEMMKLYSLDSPFSYDRHKAYLTKLHKDEIREHGLERIHRKSYNITL
jgi:ribonuclease HII